MADPKLDARLERVREPIERVRKAPRDIVALMGPIGLFEELSPRERAVVSEIAEVVRCLGRTKVFEAGDEGKYLYCVLQGRLELRTVTGPGMTHAVREIPAGRMAGLDAVLTQAPYHMTCIALENTAALRFHTAQLHQLLGLGTPAAIKLFVAMRTELGADIRAATMQVVNLLEQTSARGSSAPTGAGGAMPTAGIQTTSLPGGNPSRG